MRVKIESLITLAGAACVTIFTCSKLNHQYSEDQSLLSQVSLHPPTKVKFQSLGEDDDWNVGKWSKKHLSAVSADNLDKPSVKNIWHSRSEAWTGIDRIFPTEGGYAYQTNHFLNGNEAKLLDYMKMVKTTLKGMEAHLPISAPSNLHGESTTKFEQETKEIKGIISTESEALEGVIDQTRQETTVHDKAVPTMLAQQQSDLTMAEQSEIARVAALQGEHERLEAAHLRFQAQLRQRAAHRSTFATQKAAGAVAGHAPGSQQLQLEPATLPTAPTPPAPRPLPPAPSHTDVSSVGLAWRDARPGPATSARALPPAAAAKGKQAGRVYLDEAQYGEGIAGDLRPLGNARRWRGRAARADMDGFFDSLPGGTAFKTAKAA